MKPCDLLDCDARRNSSTGRYGLVRVEVLYFSAYATGNAIVPAVTMSVAASLRLKVPIRILVTPHIMQYDRISTGHLTSEEGRLIDNAEPVNP